MKGKVAQFNRESKHYFKHQELKVLNINNQQFLALIHAIKKVKSVNVDKGLLKREVLDETLIINHHQEMLWQQLAQHHKASF